MNNENKRGIRRAIHERENSSQDCKKQGKDWREKKLKEAWHNTGYEYHNKNSKSWFYAGEGERPLYQSVFEFINVRPSSPDVKQNSPRKPQVNSLDVNSVRNEGEHIVHTGFTPEEVAILRDLIKIYVLDEQHKENKRDRDVYQRVITLEKRVTK
ncbi:hypothetical protein [Peribacillus butanolivorans]|uniref:hypothetical protein n=1 Tax=Peribacillus butanolivorans TaxID=421767 RepID=UPI0035DE2261